MNTRLLKAQCGDCAYTVRVTRRWLRELGPPLCPCNSRAMECAQWERLCELEAEAWEAEQHSEARASRTLRDRWVTLRSVQRCVGCDMEMWHGEQCRHRVYTVGREFLSEYTCLGCNERTRARIAS